MITDGVEVVDTNMKGRTAVATKEFEIGTIVLREKSAITLTPLPMDSPFIAVSLKFSLPPGFFEAIHATFNISSAVLSILFKDLYTPLHETEEDGVTRYNNKAEVDAISYVLESDDVFSSCFPTPGCRSIDFWKRQRDAHDGSIRRWSWMVCRFVHACRVNQHMDERLGVAVIFLTCSKFAHSCNPNTFWLMTHDDDETCCVGQHVAMRNIAVGEELSFSYVGTGWNILCPTIRRRHALHHLNFVCRCMRCASYDCNKETCRTLRCPDCGELSLRMDGTTDQWVCSGNCAAAASEPHFMSREKVSVPLQIEQYTEAVVMRLFFGTTAVQSSRVLSRALSAPFIRKALDRSDGGGPLASRWSLVQLVRGCLGPTHYLFPIAYCALLRSLILGVASHLQSLLVAPVGTTDINLLLCHLRNRHQSDDELWTRELVRDAADVESFFQFDAPFGPLHLRFICYVQEVMTLLTQSVLVHELVGAEESTLQTFGEAFCRDPKRCVTKLRHWKEFNPLALRVDDLHY